MGIPRLFGFVVVRIHELGYALATLSPSSTALSQPPDCSAAASTTLLPAAHPSPAHWQRPAA